MLKNNPALLVPGFVFSLLAILALAGCGGGVSTTHGNPSGFTNSSFNGTYAFAITGANGGGFFTFAGSLTANGSGMITGGTEDIISPGGGVVAQNVALSGTYAVRSDGRTFATINSSGVSPAVSFQLDFVLLNSSKGLVIRFDGNGTASGTIDLQNSSAFSLSSLAGAFTFNVSGVDGVGNPESSVGLINTTSSGNITGGSLDDNDNFVVNQNVALTPTTFSAPGANGRGTAVISSTLGTRNFAYYVVDTNHLKLVEFDASGPFLAGDAFRQSSTTVSGSFAFTLAGATPGLGAFVSGGILNTDGAGNIQSTSVEDIDDNGSLTVPAGATVQGTYSVSGGRGTMQLTGPLTQNIVFYPSTGGLQMLDVDTSILADGAALQQSGAPFSNGSLNSGFGLNFTGLSSSGEIDAISQFNTTGNGALSGALDVNNGGATSNSLALSGNYTIAANGRGTLTLHTSQGTLNLVIYLASTTRVVFVELDEPSQVSVGTIQAQ